MVMSWIFTGAVVLSILSSLISGHSGVLSAAALQGAQGGITLSISMAGSICLWSGIGRLLEASGISGQVARLLRPVLHHLFPSTKENPELSQNLSGNICANLLGLGNAATPLGIRAAKGLRQGDTASDELCRLIVLNTASIQLIPANVAAIRSGLGSSAPFAILPAVWISSICSAGLGLLAASLLGRVLARD